MKSLDTESAEPLFSLNILTYDSRLAFRLKQYLSSIGLVWLAIAFYHNFPYYKIFLSDEVQTLLLITAICYTALALPFYLLAPSERVLTSRGYKVLQTLGLLARQLGPGLTAIVHINRPNLYIGKENRFNLMFIAIKLFFLPLMLTFFFSSYHSIQNGISGIASSGHYGQLFSIGAFNSIIFPLLLSFLFLIDTGFFALGYATESKSLGNRLRSVDSTWLGWLVVLACYPPFNNISNNYLHWYGGDAPTFTTVNWTFVAHITAVLLIGIYAASSVALGFKASNLTNRGVVSRGPYAFIRHPAYITKNLAWWLSIIPIFSFKAALSMGAWSSIYYLRAITEERHLNKDPDYQKYCKKVKYRFIPGVV